MEDAEDDDADEEGDSTIQPLTIASSSAIDALQAAHFAGFSKRPNVTSAVITGLSRPRNLLSAYRFFPHLQAESEYTDTGTGLLLV